MLLRDIKIRRVDTEREAGMASYGCNWVAEWGSIEYYFTRKPSKHRAKEALMMYIWHQHC